MGALYCLASWKLNTLVFDTPSSQIILHAGKVAGASMKNYAPMTPKWDL